MLVLGHVQLGVIHQDHADVLDQEVVSIEQLVKVMNLDVEPICVVINVMAHVELVPVHLLAVLDTTV